jgi:TetR/AcrR family transcriptional repressor of mexJK operon
MTIKQLQGHDDRATQILAAAKDLFLSYGYVDTSMDEVATHARVSKTTLYTRYPSKEALFAAVIEAYNEVSRMHFEPTEFDRLSITDALYEIGDRFVELVCSPEGVRFDIVIHSEAVRFPGLVETYRRTSVESTVSIVEAYLTHAVKRGLAEIPDCRFAALQFLISVRGYPQAFAPARQFSQTESSKRSRIRKAVALFVNGIGPRDRAVARKALR